jgi:hypothetical protein
MPKIWRAVKSWMSCRSSNARRRASSPERCAKLDLTVIGGQERVVGAAGHEGAPDAPPELAADRNVLQIRIRRRKPSGSGRGLVELRSQPFVGGIDELRNDVDVGVLELGDFAPFQDEGANRVLAR